jgi:hypothetical protein
MSGRIKDKRTRLYLQTLKQALRGYQAVIMAEIIMWREYAN